MYIPQQIHTCIFTICPLLKSCVFGRLKKIHEILSDDLTRGELGLLSDLTESSATIVHLGTYAAASRFWNLLCQRGGRSLSSGAVCFFGPGGLVEGGGGRFGHTPRCHLSNSVSKASFFCDRENEHFAFLTLKSSPFVSGGPPFFSAGGPKLRSSMVEWTRIKTPEREELEPKIGLNSKCGKERWVRRRTKDQG